jgi:integrase
MPERLTDARVRSAQPKPKRYSIMDTVEPGLELRVQSDGRRIFALRRSVAGRDVRITLGPYGSSPHLSLDQARGQAAELKVRLRNEGDFRAADRAAREVLPQRRACTVNDLIEAWLLHAEPRLRGSTLALHRHRLDKHVRPAFGDRALEQVSRADVRGLVDNLGEQGLRRTANSVAQLVSRLFRFAGAELGHQMVNPAADLKPFPESARTRVLSDNELAAFCSALDDPDLPPGPPIALVLKIAMYSGQRIGEIVGMRDGELNMQERLWTVPAERTKSGRPNHVPLTTTLIRFIENARDLRGATLLPNAPVFASPRDPTAPMKRMAASQGMARLCRKLEIAPASPHDLRRTARTILSRERLGVSYDDAERVMSHLTGSSVSRVYIVDGFLAQKRRALERLGGELDRILADQTVKSPASSEPGMRL